MSKKKINKLTRATSIIIIWSITTLLVILYAIYSSIKVIIDNNVNNKFNFFLLILTILIFVFSLKTFYWSFINIKMYFREKTLKNKKMFIVKNIKQHNIKIARIYGCYFTGTILNPKTKKKHKIKTELYDRNFFGKNPKVLFIYVDENNYSKYYVDLKKTNDFMYNLDFKYFEDIFRKYDAFSEKNSVQKEIIEKECELDLKYLLKQKIIIETAGKYYYSLETANKVININREYIKKEKMKSIKIILAIFIITIIFSFILIYYLESK